MIECYTGVTFADTFILHSCRSSTSMYFILIYTTYMKGKWQTRNESQKEEMSNKIYHVNYYICYLIGYGVRLIIEK